SNQLSYGASRRRIVAETETRLRVRRDELKGTSPGVVRSLLELFLLAVEEAVRRAFELDELVLDPREPERALELEVVLVADALVGAALQREDRAAHLRYEWQRARRPPVDADGAVDVVARRPP